MYTDQVDSGIIGGVIGGVIGVLVAIIVIVILITIWITILVSYLSYDWKKFNVYMPYKYFICTENKDTILQILPTRQYICKRICRFSVHYIVFLALTGSA